MPWLGWAVVAWGVVVLVVLLFMAAATRKPTPYPEEHHRVLPFRRHHRE